MNDKFSECQTPFTKCWCEAVPGRMNNPRCQGLAQEMPINDPVFIYSLIFLGILLVLIKLKIINMKNLFERFYDAVGQFLSNGKSFAPNECKSFK